jgi:signal transduction histidine kinase
LHGLNAQTARAREDLQRIFGPLFSTKKGSGGTALRLSITNGVFPVLGGQISVASDLGNGATVMVTLLVGTREV